MDFSNRKVYNRHESTTGDANLSRKVPKMMWQHGLKNEEWVWLDPRGICGSCGLDLGNVAALWRDTHLVSLPVVSPVRLRVENWIRQEFCALSTSWASEWVKFLAVLRIGAWDHRRACRHLSTKMQPAFSANEHNQDRRVRSSLVNRTISTFRQRTCGTSTD